MTKSNREWLAIHVQESRDPALVAVLRFLLVHYDDIIHQGQLHGVTLDMTQMPEAFRAAMYKRKGQPLPVPPQTWEEMELVAMMRVCLERDDMLSWLLTGINAYLYT